MGARSTLATFGLAFSLAIGYGATHPPTSVAPEPLTAQAQQLAPIATPIVASKTSAPAGGGLENALFIEAKSTTNFTFHVEPDSYALHNLEEFAANSEILLEEMTEKLGEKTNRSLTFYLYGTHQANFSALSFFGSSVIQQQLSAKSGKPRTKAVTAHELAHHITFQTLGYPKSIINLEGIAHWASEPYWVKAEGRTFDEKVRRRMAAGRSFPLAELVSNPSLWKGETQLIAYDEAASFVGYLIEIYGLDRFKRVYIESNYEEVYGRSLWQLEQDWLAYLHP